MKCPEINDIHFSLKGREAIHDIGKKQQLGDLLATVLGGSVVLSLFVNRGTGNTRVDTVMNEYSIASNDWSVWAQAMRSVGPITRQSIKQIAFDMMETKTSPNENKFWRAVYDGCGR